MNAACSRRRRDGGSFCCARKPASVSALRANDQCGDLGPGEGSRTFEGVEPMGRGRAKAKQVKVARQLKYSGGGMDLDQLRAEFGVGTDQRDADDHAAYAEFADRYSVDDDDEDDDYAAYANYAVDDDEDDDDDYDVDDLDNEDDLDDDLDEDDLDEDDLDEDLDDDEDALDGDEDALDGSADGDPVQGLSRR
jgi:Protein of unknown function (DUF3073)